jgi:hypothetical protein
VPLGDVAALPRSQVPHPAPLSERLREKRPSADGTVGNISQYREQIKNFIAGSNEFFVVLNYREQASAGFVIAITATSVRGA